jgi:hypothetical protein
LPERQPAGAPGFPVPFSIVRAYLPVFFNSARTPLRAQLGATLEFPSDRHSIPQFGADSYFLLRNAGLPIWQRLTAAAG